MIEDIIYYLYYEMQCYLHAECFWKWLKVVLVTDTLKSESMHLVMFNLILKMQWIE